MLLPNNGRILILDDQENQALPLIKALSFNKVPYTYHTEKLEELPLSPYNDVRVLFLDINLTGETMVWESIKSQLIVTLKKLILPNTPYIMGLWSIKEDELRKEIVVLFENELKDFKPFIMFHLKKGDYFDFIPEKGYVFKSDSDFLNKITLKLEEELKKIDSLELLINYENIVNTSLSEIVFDIFNLIKGEEDINISLKSIYYKFAKAIIGQKIPKDTNKIAKYTLTTFNYLLEDTIESKTNNSHRLSVLKEIVDETMSDIEEIAKMNNKLLLSNEITEHASPGSAFETVEKKTKNNIIQRIFEKRKFIEYYCKDNSIKENIENENGDIKSEHETLFNNYYNGVVMSRLNENIEILDIEVSSICDFVQNKKTLNRILPVLIMSVDDVKYLKSNTEYLYVSPLINYKNKVVKLVIDFRFFKTQDINCFRGKTPVFRIRQLFLIELQSKISRHHNRPGITFLE